MYGKRISEFLFPCIFRYAEIFPYDTNMVDDFIVRERIEAYQATGYWAAEWTSNSFYEGEEASSSNEEEEPCSSKQAAERDKTRENQKKV